MALIVGLLVPVIYLIFPKRGIILKLPDSVPPTISKSFSALIPSFAVLLIFSTIRHVFVLTPFGNANIFVYQMVAQPLNILGSSPLAVLVFILFCQLLWFFGIHGFLVILPFVQTIYMPMSLENLAAYAEGTILPNAITYQHFSTYVMIGGSGGLLGLAILMAFTSKSARYKTLGRLGLPSTIFGINEPIIFGTPMVLNPVMFLAFLFGPMLCFLIPYTCQMFGIISTLRGIATSLGTPVILNGWLQGGLPIVIMQIILVLFQTAFFYPFFRILDKQAVMEEKEESVA